MRFQSDAKKRGAAEAPRSVQRKMKYRIYASLNDEINAGWIWIGTPTLPSRCIIRICNLANGKKVYCEALQIEDNFTNRYNKDGRCTINDAKSSMVINAWYRKKLGDLATQTDQDLDITSADNWWGKVRSCVQHPQVIVRIGTWLGIISVGLGLLGVALGILSLRGNGTRQSAPAHSVPATQPLNR